MPSHAYAGCGGTPDSYDSETQGWDHTWSDPGGIWHAGWGAFWESQRYYSDQEAQRQMDCMRGCESQPWYLQGFCYQGCSGAMMPINRSTHHYQNTMSTEQNILQIPAEFQYLYQLIRFRLGKYFPAQGTMEEPAVPELQHWNPALANFIAHHKLTKAEAILLLIGLSPHLHPDLFDTAIENSMKGAGDFPRIGGVRGKNFRGFLPTGETAFFLLADESWTGKQQLQQLFWSDHLFGKKKILWIEELPSGEPSMSGRLIMSQDYIDTFTHGRPVPTAFQHELSRQKRSPAILAGMIS